jgi:anti-anti-sigma regulatory factor
MQATRIELTHEHAAASLSELLAQLEHQESDIATDSHSIVVDCTAITSLDYVTLQNLLRLRGRCVLTGTHKLEACMQRYGISSLTDSLSNLPINSQHPQA